MWLIINHAADDYPLPVYELARFILLHW